MSDRKSLVILQGILAEYRLPLFRRLAQIYDLTVVHSGAEKAKSGEDFAEVVLPVQKIGPFHLQPWQSVRSMLKSADVAIGMFDLGWPAYIWPVFCPPGNGRYILWGHRYGRRRLPNIIRNIIMRRADGLLMYGWEHHQRMIAAGISADRIFVAPNTMDVSNYQDFSRNHKTSVLFVGRLQERKRLDLAIHAFADAVAVTKTDLVFDIIGDGPPLESLRAICRDRQIESKVTFHGNIRDDAVLAGFFAKAIAYFSPGPVGLSVLHSFAYGVPVITLRSGYHGPEFHNLIHGANAVIVDNESQLAAQLAQFIHNPTSARDMGEAAYLHYAQSRTIDQMVAGFVQAVEGTPDI